MVLMRRLWMYILKEVHLTVKYAVGAFFGEKEIMAKALVERVKIHEMAQN